MPHKGIRTLTISFQVTSFGSDGNGNGISREGGLLTPEQEGSNTADGQTRQMGDLPLANDPLAVSTIM